MARMRPAPGCERSGPNPTDRCVLGNKRHIAVDRRAIPLTRLVAGATPTGMTSRVFEAVIDANTTMRIAGGRGGDAVPRHESLAVT